MSAPPSATIPRRHDLDALRAVAMLLGIVLHAAISFIPHIGAYWPVEDSRTHIAFALPLAAIHGFRMPIFFLISGFFTAMLWRKRGLQSLLFHRFRRIFLPLVLGMFTIIPATWIVTFYVRSPNRAAGSVEDAAGASAEQESGDAQAIIMAAANGDARRLASLIEGGADINAKNEHGSTPLHVAVFFGRVQAVEILLDANADVEALNGDGKRPHELLSVPWGITKFVADLIGVTLDKEELLQGRSQIADLLGVPANGPITDAVGAKTGFGGDVGANLLLWLLTSFPFFGHLWFLWFLCWLVIGFAICVKVGGWIGFRGIPAWVTVSSWRYAWLLPLTALPQAFMGQPANEFGPDTSLGLLPLPAVLAYYAIFFGFGALYFDADDQRGRVGREWWIVIPVGLLVCFPAALAIGSKATGVMRAVFVLCQVAYAWLVSFGMMGLFRRWLSRESKAMRYLSDSSYWLYLAHIPLIIYLQYVVRDWPLPALVKFTLICAVTSGVLLLSYQLFVRYTPLGTLLNGPRRRHPKPSAIFAAEVVGDEPGRQDDLGVVD